MSFPEALFWIVMGMIGVVIVSISGWQYGRQPPRQVEVSCARAQMVTVMSDGIWRCAKADALVDVK